MVRLTREPLSVDPVVAAVSRRTSGAVATFLGIAREFTEGHRVVRLEYEAYEEMALPMLRQLAAAGPSRTCTSCIASADSIGEASVTVAVVSPHRVDAFDTGPSGSRAPAPVPTTVKPA